MIEDEKRLATVIFGEPVSLRDWSDADAVTHKLVDLAKGASGFESRERVNFRKIYQRAWKEACDAEAALPPDLPVAAVTSLGFTVLK